jgi:hypothetical protein
LKKEFDPTNPSGNVSEDDSDESEMSDWLMETRKNERILWTITVGVIFDNWFRDKGFFFKCVDVSQSSLTVIIYGHPSHSSFTITIHSHHSVIFHSHP